MDYFRLFVSIKFYKLGNVTDNDNLLPNFWQLLTRLHYSELYRAMLGTLTFELGCKHGNLIVVPFFGTDQIANPIS
jgi:hypothetical protein